jgi:hypothetical protein
MPQTTTENKFRLEKIIYPKKKRFLKEDKGKKLLGEILQLEIDEHLRKYPDLKPVKYHDPKKNPDGSQTFAITFHYK